MLFAHMLTCILRKDINVSMRNVSGRKWLSEYSILTELERISMFQREMSVKVKR